MNRKPKSLLFDPHRLWETESGGYAVNEDLENWNLTVRREIDQRLAGGHGHLKKNELPAGASTSLWDCVGVELCI